jgi:gamma-glutamyltranspeptidase / glutathione hydrolase
MNEIAKLPRRETVERWSVRKPIVEAEGGLVASQHWQAAEAGARVLGAGGNAVDAAIAASFAVGVLEPWMSGIGGVGWMLVYSARDKRVRAIDASGVAPKGLRPEDYSLTGRKGSDLFGWPEVVDNRNMVGPYSVAVPGLVAGLGLAHKTYASKPWAELVAPAIALAEAGLLADWYVTLLVATTAADLLRYPGSRDIFLPKGLPPAGEYGGPPPRLALAKLAQTLRAISQGGADVLYRGPLAAQLAADIAEAGGRLSASDLEAYQPRLLDSATAAYRDMTVHVAPGLTAGPTLLKVLADVGKRWSKGVRLEAEFYVGLASALRAAYAERLTSMGEATEPKTTSTTNLTVVDREGNMVVLTQTLLSIFGSRFLSPRTGILLNNGINWFDPRPGGPNSIAPGRRPLTNMCPTMLLRGGEGWAAMGASGGRRIMPAVCQLLLFLVDAGLGLDAACHQPRIDVSGTEMVTADPRLSPDIIAALARKFPTEVGQSVTYPPLYACPNAIWRGGAGKPDQGCAFIHSPWAAVAAGHDYA